LFWIVPSTQAYLKSRELESIAHPNHPNGARSRVSASLSREGPDGLKDGDRANSSSLQLYQTSIEVKGEGCPLKAILLRP
jgi:hypothetical protein